MSPIILKANGIRLKQWNQGTTSPEGAFAENELNPDFFVSQNLTADSSIIGSSANTARAFTARGSGSRITSSQIRIHSAKLQTKNHCRPGGRWRT